MIQDYPRRKNKSQGKNSSKGGNSNITCYTSNMNTDITQAAIVSFQTFHPGDNIIPIQVQIGI